MIVKVTMLVIFFAIDNFQEDDILNENLIIKSVTV